MTLQDFFNDNRDNRDNLCDNVFVSMRSLCFYAKPVVSIVSIVVLIICLAMQKSLSFTLIGLLLERKRGFSCILWGQH